MSDGVSGEDAPKRPGLNVETNAPSATEGAEKGSSGRKRRNRRRNRKRKGVQADNQVNGAASGAGADASADDNASSTFDTKPKGKRARRRGRRRSRRETGGQSPHNAQRVEAKSGAQQPQSATQKPSSHQTQSPVHRPKGDRNKQANGRSPNAYAALDLGTNNCRLLVAVPQQPGRFRVVDAYSRIVRLGEGLAASGRLGEEAMDRAVEALKVCAAKLNNRTMSGVRLIATEACRRAENGQAFLDRVSEEAGLSLEIVDRETEARLAVAGCASLVDRRAKGAVLFDIGGGSSELALLDLRKRRRHDLGPAMVSWTSMPVGVVTLSERHGGGKTVTPQIFENMVQEVSDLLDSFDGADRLAELMKDDDVHLLGTSGTVTTLAGIHLKLPRYDRRQVDGTWMRSDDVSDMIDTLLAMPFEERMKNPCIGRERADLVLAGCAILVAIQRRWPCERLRVADRGLREGLLTEMMNADNAWQRSPRRKGFRGRKDRGGRP